MPAGQRDSYYRCQCHQLDGGRSGRDDFVSVEWRQETAQHAIWLAFCKSLAPRRQVVDGVANSWARPFLTSLSCRSVLDIRCDRSARRLLRTLKMRHHSSYFLKRAFDL